MTLCFVIPEANGFVSGGNIYNQSLCDALKKNIVVQQLDWNTFVTNQSSATRFIFDSIYLDNFRKCTIEIPPNAVLLFHYVDVFFEQKDNLELLAERIQQLKNFSLIVATGNFARQWLIHHSIGSEKIVLIEPAIILFGKKSNHISDKLQLLMVGNFVPIKGYDNFLAELDKLQPEGVTVTILGDNTIDKTYSRLILSRIEASSYLSRTVQLPGTVLHENMIDYFEQSNLFVSASLFETFGMAVQEALQYGLPVYAIASGNLAAIRHPLIKLFINNNDMVNVIANTHPLALSKEEIIHSTIKKYSWQDAASLFKSLLFA